MEPVGSILHRIGRDRLARLGEVDDFREPCSTKSENIRRGLPDPSNRILRKVRQLGRASSSTTLAGRSGPMSRAKATLFCYFNLLTQLVPDALKAFSRIAASSNTGVAREAGDGPRP